MPEQRLQKTREAYPEPADVDRWRRPSENAAERLTSTAYRITQAQLAAEKRAAGDERL